MLYHRVPREIVGSVLYPLNDLKRIYPDMAGCHLKKYESRLELTKQTIPTKGWLWNDVIHFSPVHPEKVVSALVSSGFSRSEKSTWYELDPRDFNFNRKNSIVFLHNKQKAGCALEETEFEEYDISRIALYSEVPEATYQYFEDSIKRGVNPLMFGGIPHVLYRGTVNISKVRRIQVSS